MDEKKFKILESAKQLFLMYGVKKTTVDEIAKQLVLEKVPSISILNIKRQSLQIWQFVNSM